MNQARAERRLAVAVLTSALPRGPGCGTDMVLVRRWRELSRHAGVVAIMPTPWAPAALARLSARWQGYAAAPEQSTVDGIVVHHPRYAQLPLPSFAPWAGASMALGALGLVRRLRARGACDVLFAQSVLPDGLAAALLGRWTGTPAACLGRGTDVNVLSQATRAGRRLAAWTVRHSAAVGVVAHELAATLGRLVGGDPATVLYDGIDLERFAPGDRATARRRLRLGDEPLILYVGRLVAGKGLADLVDAFAGVAARHPTVRLALVGEGPLRREVAAQAERRGVAARVDLVGEVAYEDIPFWMQAADVFTLPSEAEGFPNVVREALACGRPVVATAVGDVPRVVTPDVGRLVPVGAPDALAEALLAVLATAWDAREPRAKVGHMTWQANADATYRFLCAAAATARAA